MSNIHSIRDYPSPNQQKRSYIPLDLTIPTKNAPSSGSGSGKSCCEETTGFFKSLFSGFNYKSFTFVITIVQIVIFIVGEFYALSMDNEDPWAYSCVLYKFGAAHTPSIVVKYEIHRLVLPILLHADISHIFGNMLGQWSFGFHLEKHYGTKKFALLYLITGIGGNLLSSVVNIYPIAIGASTSLFGLIAWRCVYLWENYDNLGPQRNRMILWMVFILVLNSGAVNQAANVDNEGHAGGFFTGVLMALLFVQEPSSSFRVKQKVALGILILFGVVTSVILVTLRSRLMDDANAYVSKCTEEGYY